MQASGDKISLAEVRKALQGPNGRNAESITYGDFEEIMSQQQQPNRGEDDGSESAKDRPYPLATRLQASQPSQTIFPQLGGDLVQTCDMCQTLPKGSSRRQYK